MAINGETLPRGQHLLSVTINTTIDRIASARLVFQDGSASAGGFNFSSGESMVPGNKIEIKAGAQNDPQILFSGIITRHSSKVRNNSAPQLIVEAKHHAIKMTIHKKSRVFFDGTDSDAISTLFSDAGVALESEATHITHPQLVQYQCSDWHFSLARARLNSKHLLTRPDGIVLQGINPEGESKADLVFGATVLEADLQLESRQQFTGVNAKIWDSANQELIEQEGSDPGLTTPGNLTGSDLANALDNNQRILKHPQLSQDEASQWANASWQESQANRVQGRIKCEGIGSLQVGDLVTLAGFSDRFNGTAFITGVRHQHDTVQGWKTDLQFGGIEPLECLIPPMSEPPASAVIPAIHGLHIAIVTSNEDPQAEHRVRVKLAQIDSDDEGTWARVACLDAGNERGTFFRPEVGDEVIVGFINDDPRAAVILGMLNSSAKPAPLTGSDDNHEKVIQTRSKMKWLLNDEKVEMSLATPAGNKLQLSEEQKAIVLEDQHGNSITLNEEGITLSSAKAIKFDATADLELNAQQAITIKAGTELKLEGGVSAEISSAAQTTVKGGIVQIN
ncbi:type VI secretion system tip protein VgrG [Halioxenophilus sp. WMMB6]|uniref:type VI secretion system tip protein VgrG n=1 Tax=Halioxenophilus sp. WMMB6 TaxID=3073815 RepID=UPI00295E78DF|nr:type VI secretion system tip protein VgrG [Halioxenophilus sp. WMMB6]